MKRFRFRLSRLETLRDVRRRQARALLALALSRVREVVRERRDRERVLAESLAVELPVSGPLDMETVGAQAAWQDSLRAGLRDSAVAEQEARERARKATADHARVSRDHRVIEQLRERQHARWLSETELEDRKFLDEIHRTVKRRLAGGEDG